MVNVSHEGVDFTYGPEDASKFKEKVMDSRAARKDTAQHVGGDDAITTRLGAVALPIGVIVLVVSEIFHPSREDPMDNVAVFREYADSDVWTTVHLGEYFGFLLLLGGLVALYYSVSSRPGQERDLRHSASPRQ